MINSVQLKNFGPLAELDWQNLGQINLVIGNNGCGKSFLLKALYSAVRTLEDFKRGDNPDSAAEILADKLFWTFQAEKIGDLVNKKTESPLAFELVFDDNSFRYSFGKDTTKVIHIENQVAPRADNSVYLPAKEVLSLFHVILESREHHKQFGFDDTYLDLAKALFRQYSGKTLLKNQLEEYMSKENIQTMIEALNNEKIKTRKEIETEKFKGTKLEKSERDLDYLKRHLDLLERHIEHLKKINVGLINQLASASAFQPSDAFFECQERLDNMLGGKIEYDYEMKRWQFKQGNQKFSVGVTAEGIKKIAILDTLLGNGYLSEKSIIFIDEPESALHPEAISKLLDIIAVLADHGIQFFMASHSYFVIKKLFLIAQEQKMSIPVLSYEGNSWEQSDLLDDMPSNAIINESIRLYKEEINLPA